MPRAYAIVRRRQLRELQARQGTARVQRWAASGLLTFALVLVSAVALVISAAAAAYAYFTRDLPPADKLQAVFSPDNPLFFQTSRFYDRTGQVLLYEVIDPQGGDRQYMALGDLPQAVISATVALEDKTFFTNPGYDLYGISRALISNLQGGQVQGGSSITQQLIKNTLIAPEERAVQSYPRKVREILLAAEITRLYSKEQILEWYLNTNFYGNLAYGIDAAALVYFGKHADELTLGEAALLVAIPQSPGINPATDLEESRRRGEVVLDVMAREGFITTAQAEAARREPLTVREPVQRYDIVAPHFSVYARQQVEQLLEQAGYDGPDLVNRGGLRIITTLDLPLQRQAECTLRTQIARLSGAPAGTVVAAEGGAAEGNTPDCTAAAFLPELAREQAGQDYHVTNGATLILRPGSGEILAMVGSADYWDARIDGAYNIAVDGQRQPGSSFKPFTYVEALRLNYAPASLLLDVPMNFITADGGVYAPENYDRKFHGPVSLRQALQRSYNIPAVDLMNRVGVDNVIRLAHRLGIDTLETGQYGLALTLGGGEVTLMDMTYAYSVFANGGVMAGQAVPVDRQKPGFRQLDPAVILRVEDANGKVLYSYESPGTQPILSPELAYLINDVLSDNNARTAAFGRDNPLYLPGRPAAAKTGTTNDFRDNWTIGYTPQLAIGVWVGNADNTPMKGVSGLTGAAPIWHALMTYATQSLPLQGWTQPPGIERIRVCESSGLLPTTYCPKVREEVFLQGTAPTTPDNQWQPVMINRETGKRATACTPPELVEARVYQVLPPEAADWATQGQIAQPPSEYDAVGGTCLTSGNAILATPQPFATLRGTIEISGTAHGDGFAFYRLQIGQGLYPQAFTAVGPDVGTTVDANLLGTWNTSGLDGVYTLQLIVARTDPAGGPPILDTAAVPVTIDNIAPTGQLLAPAPGATIDSSQNETVVLQPQVSDNLSVARVVFYADEREFATATTAPYSTRWPINGAVGAHTFFIRVYDGAGNFAQSERVTITVR
ncbi:MAG: transglycosylase domain-containing protein [Anaerolineales bacterium]|nr:transglycosylase domain-containing protein [Anaerolineales bacterium]